MEKYSFLLKQPLCNIKFSEFENPVNKFDKTKIRNRIKKIGKIQ